MNPITERLAAALADRYRIERAATYVAARHAIASRFSWWRILLVGTPRGQEISQ
jgi:hypothetical protein